MVLCRFEQTLLPEFEYLVPILWRNLRFNHGISEMQRGRYYTESLVWGVVVCVL